PRVYQQYAKLIIPEGVLLIRGQISSTGDRVKIVAEEVSPLLKKINASLYLQIREATPRLIRQVQHVLSNFPGSSPVYLYFPREKKLARVSRDYWINLASPVVTELAAILGPDNVRIKESPGR
ncbi:MAG: DNA polymerase III subunit alpha, partial [Desulfofundulus sp.]